MSQNDFFEQFYMLKLPFCLPMQFQHFLPFLALHQIILLIKREGYEYSISSVTLFLSDLESMSTQKYLPLDLIVTSHSSVPLSCRVIAIDSAACFPGFPYGCVLAEELCVR